MRKSARDAILDAAAALAAERGVTALGVEQVNRRAGVSKGAFFYHFKTKEEMIHALVERVSGAFAAGVEARIAAGARFSEALVEATFKEVRERAPLLGALIAAVHLDPSLGAHVAAQTDAWTRRMTDEDGIPPERAALVRLCLDGLMLSTLLYEFGAKSGRITACETRIRGLLAGQAGA